jgi:hypothetical protein
MASLQDSKHRSDDFGGMRLALAERVTVYDLFRRHARVLAGLPGEVSQFEEMGFGYEWRCECSLGTQSADPADPPGSSPRELWLHFSVIDMRGRLKPAAVLYLVEEREGLPAGERELLPLNDLSETHELLNRHLSGRQASIGALERADEFITELAAVREAIGQEVDWTEAPG